MRRAIPYMLALAAIAALGCDTSEPLKDERAHKLLSACCDATRERVASIKDVESDRFREHCNGCRQGKTRADCSSGARRALMAVGRAYSDGMLPGECNTLHADLKAMGIEFEKP